MGIGRWGQDKPGVPASGGDRARADVVDLSLARSLATRASSDDRARALGLARFGDRAASSMGRGTGARPAQADGASVYHKLSNWQSGSEDYSQLSARLVCSEDGIAVVRVAGEVDFRTAPVLAAAVNEALRDGASAVFVDLAQVCFFGAAGASALTVARRQCQRRGVQFSLLRPSRAAHLVLSFTDLLGPQPGGEVINLRDQEHVTEPAKVRSRGDDGRAVSDNGAHEGSLAGTVPGLPARSPQLEGAKATGVAPQVQPSWSSLGEEDLRRRADAPAPRPFTARVEVGTADPFVVDWALVEGALGPQRVKGYAQSRAAPAWVWPIA